MRLFDKSFWTFYSHTGVIPDAGENCKLGAPIPLAAQIMTCALLAPGNDVLDPKAISDKLEANTIRIPKAVLAMVPLQPQRIRSDAMGVPQSLIAPVHQSIATYFRDMK